MRINQLHPNTREGKQATAVNAGDEEQNRKVCCKGQVVEKEIYTEIKEVGVEGCSKTDREHEEVRVNKREWSSRCVEVRQRGRLVVVDSGRLCGSGDVGSQLRLRFSAAGDEQPC